MNPIYFDIETTGLDVFTNKVTLIQILQDNKIRLIRDITPEKITEIKLLLESNLVVGQNLKFDLKFMKYHFGIEPQNIFDTYIAELVISGGLKARTKGAVSLKALAQQYIGIEMKKDKELRTSFDDAFTTDSQDLTYEQIEYAAMDVAVLPDIYTKQMKMLEAYNLLQIYNTEIKCIPAVIWLELSGLPIDIEKLNELRILTEAKILEAENKIKQIFVEKGLKQNTLFGEEAIDVNLNSPKELLNALNMIGISVASTGDDVLAMINQPIGQFLRDHRTAQKLLGSFINAYPDHINKVTGRIHPSFNQYGANTGRFSSNNPNMQQVPHEKEIRSIFKAPEGSKIVTADYSQIELRIIAEVSREPQFVQIYKNNGDLHKRTASMVLGKPESEITKEERHQAKAINFGFAYGLGGSSFQKKAKNDYGVDIPIEKAMETRAKFFSSYPVLDRYLKDIGLKAAQDQQITNKAGRIVKFDLHLEKWQYENMGKNTPIQSLSADITKTAMGKLYTALKPFNVKLINTVHDELVFEIKDENVEVCKKIINDIMEESAQKYITSIPSPVEVGVSQVWSK
jgi:DNA polymerase I-like protein with 3'-5' exonuclease and polymerase domains